MRRWRPNDFGAAGDTLPPQRLILVEAKSQRGTTTRYTSSLSSVIAALESISKGR